MYGVKSNILNFIGNKPATSTGGGLFGGGSTTTGTSGGSLFGSKPTGTTGTTGGGLFGGGSTTSGATGGGLFGPKPQATSQPIQPDTNSQEIEAILQNYAAQIDPSSTKNEFVFCMYNKFGKNVNPQLKEQIKNIFPIKDIAKIPENTKLSGEATNMKQVEVFVDQK